MRVTSYEPVAITANPYDVPDTRAERRTHPLRLTKLAQLSRSPVDETECVRFMVVWRNYARDEPDEKFIKFTRIQRLRH